MGFSQADWLELQRLRDKLHRIRTGSRTYRPPPIQLSFLPNAPEKPKRPRKPPEEPGYARYQRRLW